MTTENLHLVWIELMGQEEELDSDMGHWTFLITDMVTWPFLKIDLGHGDPLSPHQGPIYCFGLRYILDI